MRVLKSKLLLTELTCHSSRRLTSCAAQCTEKFHAGTTGAPMATTNSRRPDGHKPVQGTRSEGARNEFLSVVMARNEMSDPLMMRYGKPGNNGRTRNLYSRSTTHTPTTCQQHTLQAPSHPLAETRGAAPQAANQPTPPHSTTALVYKADRPRPAVGLVVPVAGGSVAEAPAPAQPLKVAMLRQRLGAVLQAQPGFCNLQGWL